MCGKGEPNQSRKSYEGNRAEDGSGRVQRGGLSSAALASQSPLRLFLPLALRNERSGRRKDCWKREKEAAPGGTERLRNKSSSYCRQTSERKSNCVLLPLRSAKCREIDGDSHGCARANRIPPDIAIASQAVRLTNVMVMTLVWPRQNQPRHTQAYTQRAMAPMTIERASRAAYRAPLAWIVSARVASATEGAAPKTPAKLFGREISPTMAKRQTAKPPSKNRTTNSIVMMSLTPD